jgi:diguanylate cyclase
MIRLRGLLDRSGVTGLPRPALILTASLTAAAVVASAVGLATSVAPPAVGSLSPLALGALAVAVTMVAVLAGLRLRVGAGSATAGWGEAAIIIGLYLVPAGWLPAAAFVGAGLAGILLALLLGDRTPVEVIGTAAAVAVATTAAAGVAAFFGAGVGDAPTPAVAAALGAGATAYVGTATLLAASSIRLVHGSPFGVALLGLLRARALMFVGSVIVGLAVVASIHYQPAWLLLLPPAMLLLQHTYLQRLRAGEDVRAWRRFGAALAALNTLDEDEVAAAGVAGARDLLGAAQATLDIGRADRTGQRFRAEAGGRVLVEPDGVREPPGDGHELHRSLTVGNTTVGELRVHLSRPLVPAARDELVLSAYGEALAVALHNATGHRDLRVLTERSAYDTVHDPVTGLVNRGALVQRGDQMLRELPPDRPVALLLLDIDRFKDVNDTLGHRGGDQLLALTARRLAALAGPDELIGRVGVDEFALLTAALAADRGPDPADDQSPQVEASAQAQRLVDALAQPTEVAGVTMAVQVSAGVVVAPAGSADLTELVRRAAIAVSQAKLRAGSVAGYDSGQDAASIDRLVLLGELRAALAADDQLMLAMQPAVDLVTGGPAGVEALVRWQHPRRGTLHPGEFVNAAEASDVDGRFTRYVIDRALAEVAGWAAQGMHVPVSVNVSAHSLLDPRLPADIAEILRRHGVAPAQLVVEITESVVMSELPVIDEVLAALRGIGVQLAVDDFGTGFSSLAFLARVPVDEIKIDRSFVTNMIESPAAEAIVQTTVELGRRLGMRVVAEGVETAEQRRALAELGCSAAQGFLFFKPLPANKILAVLQSLTESAEAARVLPLRADGAS